MANTPDLTKDWYESTEAQALLAECVKAPPPIMVEKHFSGERRQMVTQRYSGPLFNKLTVLYNLYSSAALNLGHARHGEYPDGKDAEGRRNNREFERSCEQNVNVVIDAHLKIAGLEVERHQLGQETVYFADLVNDLREKRLRAA